MKIPHFLLEKSFSEHISSKIVQIDSKVFQGWSTGDENYDNITSLLKTNCSTSCDFIFAKTEMSDLMLGLILLFITFWILLLSVGMLTFALKKLVLSECMEPLNHWLSTPIKSTCLR